MDASTMTPLEAAERLETIDRLVLIKGIGPEYDAMRDAVKYAASYLRAIAAGKYKQVVHAHWIEDTPFSCRCSECDYWRYGLADQQERYCPNCGARMDGKNDSHAN